MIGDLNVVADGIGGASAAAGDKDFVDVEDFGEVGGDVAQADFEFTVAFERGGRLDGGGFALDGGKDGGDGGDFVAHLGFEVGDNFVRLLEGHGFVNFKVLLDVEAVVHLLHADVVDAEVAAGGDGADAVVDALGDGSGGNGVDDDVGSGKVDMLHRPRLRPW